MNDKQRTRMVKALEALSAGVDVAKDMVEALRSPQEISEVLRQLSRELDCITGAVDLHIGAKDILKRVQPRAENPT